MRCPYTKTGNLSTDGERREACPGRRWPQPHTYPLLWAPPPLPKRDRRGKAAARADATRGRAPRLPSACPAPRPAAAPRTAPRGGPLHWPPALSLTGAAPAAAAVPLSHLEGLVGGGDEEEFLVRRLRVAAAAVRRGRVPAVTVRVVLAGQLPVSTGNLRLAGLPADAQHLVADAPPAVQALRQASRCPRQQQQQSRAQDQARRRPPPARPRGARHRRRHLAAAAAAAGVHAVRRRVCARSRGGGGEAAGRGWRRVVWPDRGGTGVAAEPGLGVRTCFS